MAKAFIQTSSIAACILFAVFILGCSPQKQQGPLKEGFFNYTAYFCPGQDCLQEFSSQLQGAKASVSCALYAIDNTLLLTLSSFHNSTSANVQPEIIVDKNTKIPAAYLMPAGGFVLKRSSKGIMHNKYCIIDGAEIITGSFNPTAAAKNDYNNMLIINSTALAAFYTTNFNLLKENSPQQPTPKIALLNETLIKVFFCPQDNCAGAVERELEKANSSILFAAYSFTNSEIANELILKKSEGIAVAGVIEKSTIGSEYSKHAIMASNGIPVILESSKRLMHHKFFVIDNSTVITGSFNPTENAAHRNDENIIVVEDAGLAQKYLEEFGRIAETS